MDSKNTWFFTKCRCIQVHSGASGAVPCLALCHPEAHVSRERTARRARVLLRVPFVQRAAAWNMALGPNLGPLNFLVQTSSGLAVGVCCEFLLRQRSFSQIYCVLSLDPDPQHHNHNLLDVASSSTGHGGTWINSTMSCLGHIRPELRGKVAIHQSMLAPPKLVA